MPEEEREEACAFEAPEMHQEFAPGAVVACTRPVTYEVTWEDQVDGHMRVPMCAGHAREVQVANCDGEYRVVSICPPWIVIQLAAWRGVPVSAMHMLSAEDHGYSGNMA
jgi:hypothetical protein